ncbi:hypothetical protein EVAR_23722_1 [Eumeta japonica]|uniref:Uncharacterized protein n=1 Tax=Eumeta variegata TaxID=151549 RepID=A0A4C1VIF0_EUMVA|nr:hypothetical protein EVAR_23722_1 [Eumeta japonica]
MMVVSVHLGLAHFSRTVNRTSVANVPRAPNGRRLVKQIQRAPFAQGGRRPRGGARAAYECCTRASLLNTFRYTTKKKEVERCECNGEKKKMRYMFRRQGSEVEDSGYTQRYKAVR